MADIRDLRDESWSRLMRRVQAGDEAAYRTLLDELGPILHHYTRKRVFNPSLVDDVYQEILLTFHRARHSYQPDRPFAPWFFTVARNALLDALGRNRKFQEREVPHETLPERFRPELDGSLDDDLAQALRDLPEGNRRAVELLKLRGLTLEETAREMGLSVAAVKVRAHRGYVRLRRTLAARGRRRK